MPRAPRSEPFEVSESDIAPVRRFELLYRDRLGLPLSAASADDRIAALLAPLGASSRGRLIAALSEIESVLAASPGDVPSSPSSFVLRSHRPGDLGWIVHRHAILYSQEYGWGPGFEGLVAGIAAKFIEHHDPLRERLWIAERDGESVGSVCLVADSKTVARLRLLLVEPSARGLGIGRRLVNECEQFARAVGYRRIVLWTHDILIAARNIYRAAGYHMTHSERHNEWGDDVVGETWELELSA